MRSHFVVDCQGNTAGVVEWQTRWAQNSLGVTPRAGSSPAPGTTEVFAVRRDDDRELNPGPEIPCVRQLAPGFLVWPLRTAVMRQALRRFCYLLRNAVTADLGW